MKEFTIEGGLGTSRVIAGGKLAQLGDLCGVTPSAVVTDENVRRLHGKMFPEAPVIEVPPGEGSKSLARAGDIFRRLAELEVDRAGFILAIGGGVVCDLAGFCAATFMRGIAFGFVPTTLLAQVDAAIGGKNGVNLDGYKNLVGTFTQPEFVLCDTAFLRTLPEEGMREGLAESIKAGAIGDARLFELIEGNAGALIAREQKPLYEMIERAVAVKVEVVADDERESGRRRVLNFGHTFGHALERTCDIPHGEAISIGMAIAARLSVARGTLAKDDCERLIATLCAVGLPTTATADANAAIDAMRRDKKRAGGAIEFVLLEGIGRAVTKAISLDELAEVASDLR